MNRKDNAMRMRKLVADFRNSEMSFNKFAVTHGISRGKLHYWVKQHGNSTGLEPIDDSGNFIPLDLPMKTLSPPKLMENI